MYITRPSPEGAVSCRGVTSGNYWVSSPKSKYRVPYGGMLDTLACSVWPSWGSNPLPTNPRADTLPRGHWAGSFHCNQTNQTTSTCDIQHCGKLKYQGAISELFPRHCDSSSSQISGGHNIHAQVTNVAVRTIKEGRELRVQPYNEYRKRFNLKPYASFREFTGETTAFELWWYPLLTRPWQEPQHTFLP